MTDQYKGLGREPLEEIVLKREPEQPPRRFTHKPNLDLAPITDEDDEETP